MALQALNSNRTSRVAKYRRKHCDPLFSKYITYISADDMDPGVTDTNSMFFLTNAWMVAISVLILLVLDKGHISHVLQNFKGLSLLQYGVIILNTVSDNISTVLNVQLLASVPMSIHTPVSGAVGKLSTAAVAGLIVKERVPLVPVIIAIISTLLTFFEL